MPDRALPQTERAREHARHAVLAGQEHALPGHEHVVEDDEALGHAVVRARGVVELVQLAGAKLRLMIFTPGAFAGIENETA